MVSADRFPILHLSDLMNQSSEAPQLVPWRPVLLAVIVCSLPFAYLAGRFDWVCDDAFISFRYARNLAAGLGLAYNPGESPPVEGYTNLLWVLLMSVVERLGSDPAIWSRVLSLSSAIGLFLWVGRFVQRAVDGRLGVLVPTLLFCVTLPSIDVWATSGLAVMPMALCLFGVYDRLLRDPEHPHAIQAGLLACAAALLRADAPVYLALILGLALGTAILGRRKTLLRAVFFAGGILALCVAAQFAWRYSYYGDWLPNTARVKALSGDAAASALRRERGLYYVISYYLTVTSMIVVPLASLVLLRCTRSRRVVMHGLVMLAGASGYAMMAGGDFMAFGRFLVPAMPFIALLMAVLIQRVHTRVGTLAAGAWTASCIVLSLLPMYDVHLFPKSTFDRFHFRWNDRVEKRQSEFRRWTDMNTNANKWVQFGLMLPHVTEPDDSIALGGIGAIGYYSGLHIYDTFGLTNQHWRKVNPEFKRKSPGHDREMEPQDFLEFKPTFLGLFVLVDEGSDPYARFGGEAEWNTGWWKDYSAIAKPELHTLPPDHGFPPGKALLMLRVLQTD